MRMKRKHSWPDNHWNWPVQLTHKQGVRCGEMIFTGGQVDLSESGEVRHPNNIDIQCENAMSYLEQVLVELESGFSELVKLMVYFVGDAAAEKRLLTLIGTSIGEEVRPVINTVSMPELCYPGMLVEIEGVAMRSENGDQLERKCFHHNELPSLPQTFSHVVKCGDMIFTGDMSALSPHGEIESPDDLLEQTQTMMDKLTVALRLAGAGMSDVVKLNVFYVGDGTSENWEGPAQIRADYFDNPGPAATGIALKRFSQPGMLTKIAVTAMRSAAGDALQKQFAWPQGHWNWTMPLPYKHGNRCKQMIHVGGQVSLNNTGQAIDPGDMSAQTFRAMDNIKQVLAEFGGALDDVVKVTTFYQGQASNDGLHGNLLIRSNSYSEPGPATTGIPVPFLVYEDMVIEIEVIAMLDHKV